MTGRLAQGAVLAALVLPVAPLLAADDDAAARTALQQRLRLSAQLMADGGTVQRIVASGDARALAHLDEGKVHLALAQDLLAKGDLAGARRAADDALRHLGQARRLVPDAPARQAAARSRYEQLLASLERLVDSWRQRNGPSDAEDGDIDAAGGLMHTARMFGREQRYEEAVHTLGSAEGHVLSAMKRLLNARTLDYTARAVTPAEEYQLELARLRSLVELVPLALNDLKPGADATALVWRHVETSNALREQAQQRFAAGDTPQALNQLRNALLYAQRALATAGLTLPQAVGGTP